MKRKAASSSNTTDATVEDLLDLLDDERRSVTAHAANALKKRHDADATAFSPFAERLLRAAERTEDAETRWNLVQILTRLPLREEQRAMAMEVMFESLSSPNAFLRAHALSGLAEFAASDAGLRRRVIPILDLASEDASPAVRARARKLLVAMRGS